MLLIISLGVTFYLATLWCAFLLVKKWGPALRSKIAKKFQVEIETSGKGNWRVISSIPWYKKFLIESLQIVFYMTFFFVWSFAAILMVFFLTILEE